MFYNYYSHLELMTYKELAERLTMLEREVAQLRHQMEKIERREASPHPSPRGEGAADIAEVLSKLMYHRTPDGHYLVTRKVHWQAVYRVLVDEGWYDACNSLHLSGSSLYTQL